MEVTLIYKIGFSEVAKIANSLAKQKAGLKFRYTYCVQKNQLQNLQIGDMLMQNSIITRLAAIVGLGYKSKEHETYNKREGFIRNQKLPPDKETPGRYNNKLEDKLFVEEQ